MLKFMEKLELIRQLSSGSCVLPEAKTLCTNGGVAQLILHHPFCGALHPGSAASHKNATCSAMFSEKARRDENC